MIAGSKPTVSSGVFGKQKLLAKGIAVLNGYAEFTQLRDNPKQYTSTILVANLTDMSVTIPQGMRLAFADITVTSHRDTTTAIGVVETQPVPDVLQHGVNHRLKDIRLNPYYLEWISLTLGCKLENFHTAFYNGGEYRDQCWTNTRVWVNPPWVHLPGAVTKLFEDKPLEFILIAPNLPSLAWYKALKAQPHIRHYILPHNTGIPFFTYYEHNQPIRPAPNIPTWDVAVFYGSAPELQALPADIKAALQSETSQRAPLLSLHTPTPDWLKDVHIGDCTQQEREQLLSLLQEFGDVLDGSRLGEARAFQCSIRLQPDTQPIQQRPYPRSLRDKEVIATEVDKMLKAGVIESSTSPWASPVVLVKKSDGTPRFCVDYRKVNAITETDAYPLPRIDDTLDALAGSCVFSTLDLTSGFHQIPLKPEDREITAFTTQYGLWQFTRMPFGLKNNPAIFQRVMNAVMAGISYLFVLVYIDDCIIFSKNFSEHLNHLRAVLERLRKANLTAKLKKCRFVQKELQHLGHIVSADGIKPNPAKVSAIQNIQPPTSLKELQQFLGACNFWRKFIPGYSALAAPLYALLKADIPQKNWDTRHIWTADCQHAFEALKHALTHEPLLIYPDESQPYVLMTDASDKQIGGVLLQERDGGLKPIHYLSRMLHGYELNWTVSEKECAALSWCIKQLDRYLSGSYFVAYTDHICLTWLQTSAQTNAKLKRWALELQGYNFLIVYKPGPSNVVADALSRLRILPPQSPDALRTHQEAITQKQEAMAGAAAPHSSPVTDAILALSSQVDDLSLDPDNFLCLPVAAGTPDRGWVGRWVNIPTSYWSNNWANQAGREGQVDRLRITAYIPAQRGTRAQRGTGERWRVEDNMIAPGATHPDTFDFTENAIRLFLEPLPDELPEQPTIADPEEDTPPGTQPVAATTAPGTPAPVVRPTIVTDMGLLRSAQLADPTLQRWFHWLDTKTPPSRAVKQPTRDIARKRVKDDFYQWWQRDHRDVILNEHGALIRLAQPLAGSRVEVCAQLLIPQAERERVLWYYHNSGLTGHLGAVRTLYHLKHSCYWPGMAADVHKYVEACNCKGYKHRDAEHSSELGSLLATVPNDLVAIDCMGPVTTASKTSGSSVLNSDASPRWLVVIIDHFSKFVECKAITQPTALVIVETFIDLWVRRYGPPRRLLSDRGPEFDIHMLRRMCEAFGIDKVYTTPLHPEGDGVVERQMRTFKTMIAALTHGVPANWVQHLDALALAYNSTVHESTKEVPFFLWFGRAPPPLLPLQAEALFTPHAPPYKDTDVLAAYRADMWAKLQRTNAIVLANSLAAWSQAKARHDAATHQEHWQVGDLCWLQVVKYTAAHASRKLASHWDGPFVISEIVAPQVVKLRIPNGKPPADFYRVNTARLRRYFTPFEGAWLTERPEDFLCPQVILDHRWDRHDANAAEPQYHVRWLTLTGHKDVWVSANALPYSILRDYQQQFGRPH